MSADTLTDSGRRAYEAAGLLRRRSRFTRLRGAVLATKLRLTKWDRIESKRFPAGTEGAELYPDGVKYRRAEVSFDWLPAWRRGAESAS